MSLAVGFRSVPSVYRRPSYKTGVSTPLRATLMVMATTLRRDAQRNRDRILDAARRAFAEEGLDIGVDEIARRAGLGVGTLYRRFPTKASLVEAIFEDRLDALQPAIDEALAADDPWVALS